MYLSRLTSIIIVFTISVSSLISCNNEVRDDSDTNYIKGIIETFISNKQDHRLPIIMSLNQRKGYTNAIITYASDSTTFKTFEHCYYTKLGSYITSVSVGACTHNRINAIRNSIFSKRITKNDSAGYIYHFNQNKDFISFRIIGNAKVINNNLIFEK